MKISVVVAAGGASERMGFPKLKAKVGGVSVLTSAVLPFLSFPEISDIVIAAKADLIPDYTLLLRTELPPSEKNFRFVSGGATRTESVRKALAVLPDDTEVVLVHDGARPYASTELISRVINGAGSCGAAVPVVPAAESVMIDGKPFERKNVMMVQTPQGFNFQRLLTAYSNSSVLDKEFTDDFSLFTESFPCACGKCQVAGETANIKITSPADLPSLSGIGYDIHRFDASKKGVTLCGIRVPFSKGLVAHSDGDVAIHALMDAILSAIGESDIGHHFPDTDPKYSGISSILLLKEVMKILKKSNGKILNISLSIVCESPRLAPYLDRMKAKISQVTGVSKESIGITVTTNEKIGEIGRGDAIAVLAIVSIIKL